MQSHESLSTFAVALVTGDWQEKDREMQGLVVVQILQWRQQQVRIYSRNDKSTRRKW
jgi:hypothetical protein